MLFECDITGIDPQPHLLAFFRRVLDHAADTVALDKGTVGRVIIASDDRFGPAVQSIKPGAGYTNSNTSIAGGKTIPRRDGDRVMSDIVLWCDPLGALVDVLADPPTSNDWGVDQQRALYVVCHEFGHAQDYALREDTADTPDPRAADFSINDTANYYGEIVMTEYVACRNAVSAMTVPLFNDEMQEARGRMVEYQKQVNHYLDNPDELTRRALAHFVCQGAWVIMAELAKLYGHTNGIEQRAAVRALEETLLNENSLGDTLDRHGKAYPRLTTPGQIKELTDLWQKYAGVFGVRFITGAGGKDDFERIA